MGTTYDDDDLLPISAIQHWLFCRRQCGLIHLEQAWAENRLTAQGRQLHDCAHEGGSESRGDLRVVRGLRLCSHELGLTGQADVVELKRPPPESPPDRQACVPGLQGRWIPYPVEYKRGRPKANDCDRAQLCAQAMCLEEMLDTRIHDGALFYGKPRRREVVVFDARLRAVTQTAAEDIHRMMQSGATPPPTYSPKCRRCSMAEGCLPKSTGAANHASDYLRRGLIDAIQPDPLEEDDREDL